MDSRTCVCAQSLSHVHLFATLQIVGHQASLSMGFSRKKYWSGLQFPTPKWVHNSMQYFEMALLFILYSTSCNSLVLRVFLSLSELCYFPRIHISRRFNSILYSKGNLGQSLLSCICNGGYTDDSLTAGLLDGALLGPLGVKKLCMLSSEICDL